MDFLIDIFREGGKTQATPIIRMETKIVLWDNYYTFMHLPLYYSKRNLYEKNLLNNWMRVTTHILQLQR